MVMDECPKKTKDYNLIKNLWNYQSTGRKDLKNLEKFL